MAVWVAHGTEVLSFENLPGKQSEKPSGPAVKPNKCVGIKKALFVWDLLSEVSALTQLLTPGGPVGSLGLFHTHHPCPLLLVGN